MKALIAAGTAFALVAGTSPSMAASDVGVTGNDLLKLCTDSARPGAMCVGYVVGVYETYTWVNPGRLCPGPYVTNEQITDVAVKFLTDRPEMRDKNAPLLVSVSIALAFPCPPPARTPR